MRCSSHHHPNHIVFPHSFLVSTFILILCREIQTGPLIDNNKTSTQNTGSRSADFIAGQTLLAGHGDEHLKLPLKTNDPAAQVEFPQTESNQPDSVSPTTHNPLTSIQETKPDVGSSKYVTTSAEVGTIIDHAVRTAVTDDAEIITYYHSPSDITTESSDAVEQALLPTTSSPLSLHNEDLSAAFNKSSQIIPSNISASQSTFGPTFRESHTSSPIVIVTPALVTNSSKEFVLGNPTDKNATIKTVLRTGVVSSVSVVTQTEDQNFTNSTPVLNNFTANWDVPSTSSKAVNFSLDPQNSTQSPLVLTTLSSVDVLAPLPETNTEKLLLSPTLATSINASQETIPNSAPVVRTSLLGNSTTNSSFVADAAQKQSNFNVNTSSSVSVKITSNSSQNPLSTSTVQKPNNVITTVKPAAVKPNNVTLTSFSSTSSSQLLSTTKEATTPPTPIISSVHVSELEQSAATDLVKTTQETWTTATTLVRTKDLSGTTETPTTNLISSDPTVLNIHHAEDPLGIGAIIGIILGVIGVVILVGGVCGFLIYHRRLRPLSEVKYPTDNCGYVDDSLRVSYVNNHIELPKESSEEMFSLDNDSFLNSLEAMTLQNYWAEDAKNTKV